MKPFIIILTIFSVYSTSRADNYKSLKVNYKAKSELIVRLSNIELTNIDFKSTPLQKAISILCNGNKTSNKHPVINYNLSYENNSINDLEHDEAKNRFLINPEVTYKANTVSFTEALDSICTITDHMWSIGKNDKEKYIILIQPK